MTTAPLTAVQDAYRILVLHDPAASVDGEELRNALSELMGAAAAHDWVKEVSEPLREKERQRPRVQWTAGDAARLTQRRNPPSVPIAMGHFECAWCRDEAGLSPEEYTYLDNDRGGTCSKTGRPICCHCAETAEMDEAV